MYRGPVEKYWITFTRIWVKTEINGNFNNWILKVSFICINIFPVLLTSNMKVSTSSRISESLSTSPSFAASISKSRKASRLLPSRENVITLCGFQIILSNLCHYGIGSILTYHIGKAVQYLEIFLLLSAVRWQMKKKIWLQPRSDSSQLQNLARSRSCGIVLCGCTIKQII